MAGYNQGAKVKWSWGNGTGKGAIQKIYTQKVTRTIKGTEVTREADEDAPTRLELEQRFGMATRMISDREYFLKERQCDRWIGGRA